MTLKAWQFVLGTYALSWSVALAMHLAGPRYGTVAGMMLIAVLYMPAPAYITVILQRVVYRAGLREYGLHLKGTNWRIVLLTVALVWALCLLTLGFIYLLGNLLHAPGFGAVDLREETFLANVRRVLEQRVPGAAGQPLLALPFPPAVLLAVMILQGGLVGAVGNFPFALGEELGWRGLLQKETEPLGPLRSNLLIGLVWGLWHAPIIVMGHNYPGYPVLGIAMMVLFTTAASFLLAQLRAHGGSIVAPTVFHGALNGVGGGLAFVVAGANPLLGSIAGVAGIQALVVLAAACRAGLRR